MSSGVEAAEHATARLRQQRRERSEKSYTHYRFVRMYSGNGR